MNYDCFLDYEEYKNLPRLKWQRNYVEMRQFLGDHFISMDDDYNILFKEKDYWDSYLEEKDVFSSCLLKENQTLIKLDEDYYVLENERYENEKYLYSMGYDIFGRFVCKTMSSRWYKIFHKLPY